LALVLWFYRWRQKTITHKNRVKIRINRQNFYKSPYSIEFEAMNMSKKPCSFEEKIVFNSLIVAKRKETLLHGYKYKCEFHLKNTDRFIEPHEQKNFTAITNSANPQLLASQFRKYRFRFTNGTHTMVYIATPLSNAIPYWKYSVGKFLYRVFRRVKNPT
jgi:hypothetical protein